MGHVALDEAFWKGRRVFVTGASGIVGTWMVKQLLELDAYVVALVRDADPQSELIRSGDINRTTVVNGSLEDRYVLERAINEHEVSTVFHLGAQALVEVAYRSPWMTFEANIRGTYNLLEACRLLGGQVQQIVVASSDKAYGTADVLPYTEEMPLNGRHPYDVSKSCADIIAQTYQNTYGLPVTIARCGNVYGGADLNWSRIVPGTIRSLLRGEPPILRSDGQFVRDYIYVKDVVTAYMLLAQRTDEQTQGHAFNFSTESRVTVIEIVAEIQRVMGQEDLEPVILDRAKAEIKEQSLSAGKAREMLGWGHTYDLESGLRETVDWYKAFFESDL
jgi:CDP-glucose 4,6-dehydratase